MIAEPQTPPPPTPGTPPDLPPTTPEGGFVQLLVMVGFMVLFFYFLVWRPQRRQERTRQEMLSKIQKNDHVVTTSGIHGIVAAVNGDEVTLKIDESKDIRVKFSRSAIAQVLTEQKDSAG